MRFDQFLLILKARRKVLLKTLGVCVGVTLLLSLLWPKSYTATTAIVVEAKPDPVTGMVSAMTGMQPFSYLPTQIEIIQSDRVAGKVVKAMKLDEDAQVIEDWRSETKGRGDMVVWLGKLLLKKLDVKPEHDSNVLDIEYTARDPKLAALIANQFAQAYVETSLELKVEPAREYAAWFDERSNTLRKQLETAQARLSAGEREKGIVAVDERLDVENARLADLSAQLTVIQAQAADSLSRETQAKGEKDTLPEVLQSSLVQSLKGDIARNEAKLQELAGQLGKNHPQYKRAEMELQSLHEKLDREMGRVASSITTTNRVNLQREAEIRAALAAQKTKVLELKRQRDDLAIMKQDVDGAQHSYDLILQHLNESKLESQLTQTSVAVLHPATEPVEPSKPKILLNVILAAIFGVLFGIGLALRQEMVDARIRVVEDITDLLLLPLLGVIEKTSTPAPRAWSRLRWPWPRLGAAQT